ncbi:probable leucine--tRNA ligase, mitochondrial isoform X2 [Cimex lectularius]|uniref:leucine--tRNA ligase n=1 Tax=Cimex lectularius TaxID=79782 RepID=A0A8I6TFC3_CIMLE|nr:probable leucine--tRNA ligase, mitochondrial isoform X2 [Cimex lectularius]
MSSVKSLALFRSLSTGQSNKAFFDVSRRLSSYLAFDPELTTQKKCEIEQKWGAFVNEQKFDKHSTKPKFYVLSMFPYPSGNLHMGHVRVYTISDAAARYYRMRGKNVLHPIGFDSFGLPAENAARDNKVTPEQWTEKNINTMRKQLKQLGCNFDWNREIVTSKPDYYKFTQQLFLLLHKHGLAYRKKAIVNWDPVDCTVLADEQVDSKGRSWRSGAIVEKKMLKQWFIRTTNFAEDLYEGLNDPNLKDWRDIINLQKHWIGECTGADFYFYIDDSKGNRIPVTVWVEKPEHMSKAAFLSVSSKSVLGSEILKNYQNEKLYLSSHLSNKKLPIFVTDELPFPEGCDLKLGIPSKNDLDKEFAIRENVEFDDESELDNYEERFKICNLAIKCNLGGYPKSSKLHDWLISRQRYWGTPIPIIHCEKCGEVPVEMENLPVLLVPRKENGTPQPVDCPKCGGQSNYETDTMDTFFDSSWYFLRFIDPKNPFDLFSTDKAAKLMPVDLYIGGKEHATLHLYYARFVSHFLHSLGYLKQPEPFKTLLVQGMIMGKTYYVKESLKCIKTDDIDKKGKELFEKSTGLPVFEKWEKMSKSKHNGVEPSEMFDKYGVDTTRLLVLAEVAPTSHRHWSSDSFSGVLNWQQRIWSLMDNFLQARRDYSDTQDDTEQLKMEDILYDSRNFYIKGTTFNYSQSQQFSVAISKMQGLTNSLKKCDKKTMAISGQFERTLASLIIMLFPMAPHFSSELWSCLQSAGSRIDTDGKFINWDKPVFEQSWPQLDDEYLLPLICKVNGAVKSNVMVPSKKLSKFKQEDALNLALLQPDVQKFLQGCDILSSQYTLVDNYEGTINIVIDHYQRRKILLASGNQQSNKMRS